jgi:hypothetical protein
MSLVLGLEMYAQDAAAIALAEEVGRQDLSQDLVMILQVFGQI